ncbi:uncharacterized protein B0T23DRAFT_453682 [Neurospora hispaniola]|uniref:Zn(2)-C6 fungal-type domain-containing protein n=1 Tax=Neurospora hispaniola TaxID=588809 RepID=A0AAJ0I803_9PEZI|nr:hypothetical protein B0T23DRAFT_453682 [Neurospora hispaniola]
MDLLETQVSDLRSFLGAGGLPSATTTNTTSTAPISSSPDGIGTAAAATQQGMSGSTPGASGGALGGLGSISATGLTGGSGGGVVQGGMPSSAALPPHPSAGYSLTKSNLYNSHHHLHPLQSHQRDFGPHDFTSGPMRTAEGANHGPPRPSITGSTTASLANPHDPYRRNSSVYSPHGDNSAQNDMNYGSMSPATQSDTYTQDHPTGTAPRSNRTTSGSAAKRKAADDDGASSSTKQQRSKRNRYTSIACNECKRRKIKCNGQTPCQRCGHLNLQCLYAPNCCSHSLKDSDEFKQMADQVSRLQNQVETLFSNMSALRQEALRLAPIHDRILPPPSATVTPSPSSASMPQFSKPLAPLRPPSAFNGPTSIAFTVDVAKNTLHNMGYAGASEALDDSGDSGDGNSGPQAEPTPRTSPTPLPPMQPSSYQRQMDPLWEFSKAEMIRLCKLHDEEVSVMYPVMKMEPTIQHAIEISEWMEKLKRQGMVPPADQGEIFTDDKTLLLKIVLCTALVIEEHGHSAMAARLYETIEAVTVKTLMSGLTDVLKLPYLALVAGYKFFSNDEVAAWRMMGQLMRLCFELGLHRREGLDKITDPQDRKNTINTFWIAYVLERRWSFATGLPFVCDDAKIDPKLPYPDDNPFLRAMVTWSMLAAKTWKLIDYFEPAVIRELKPSDFEELDNKILAWYDSVPEEIKISTHEPVKMPIGGTQRLQIWTRLRLNQIRIWLYTPILHSAISIAENMEFARRAVELAKETIHYLTDLNDTTNVYRRMQMFGHQFLTSSIAVLFLASTHAPLQFSASCRKEFYMALELIKDMSAKSWVSRRIWRTIGSLKKYAARLGMEEDSSKTSNPTTRNSAMARPLGRFQDNAAGGSPASSVYSPGTATYSGGGPFGRSDTLSQGTRSGELASDASTPAAHQSQMQGSSPDDLTNGLRLHNEMSRIFENMQGGLPSGRTRANRIHSPDVAMSGAGGGGYFSNLTNSHDVGMTGRASTGSPASSNGAGVYQQLRDMF